MQPDTSSEIEFRTACTGGSGGPHVNKARIATRPSLASRERLIDNKRSRSAVKEGRRSWKPGND